MSEFRLTQKQNHNLKLRESGIELLRILSIFFVVVIHEIGAFLDVNNLFVVISRIIVWPAIFSFAFVSGYFLILKHKNESKITQFLWLTLEIIIWRVLIALIFLIVLASTEHYSAGQFFQGFFENIILTLVDVKSWYFWAILFVYLIFPFFSNYLENNYKRGKRLLKWILLFLIFTSVTATVGSFLTRYFYNFSLYKDQYTIFTVLFASVLGAYWHLIEKDKKIQYSYKSQLIGLAGLIIVYLINFSYAWWIDDQATALTYLNIFWYFAGLFYFLIFKNFNFRSKFINYWGCLSWWIYIIHNGTYLPRGWAPRLIGAANLDPYSSTILTIFLCYFLTLVLVIVIKNFDKFVFKPYILFYLKSFKKNEKKTVEKTNLK